MERLTLGAQSVIHRQDMACSGDMIIGCGCVDMEEEMCACSLNLSHEFSLCCLCVNLAGLRAAQIAGKTHSLCL